MPPPLRRLQSIIPVSPTLRGVAQAVPKLFAERPAQVVARDGGKVSAEVARALPTSVNGEEPLSLQQSSTVMYDLFTLTIGESTMFYSANQWVQVTFILRTAGPVAVSTNAEVVPVLTGKGLTLVTNQPVTWVYPKGSRLYYGAESVNRVGIVIEPIPWMEQIAAEIRMVSRTVGRGAGAIVKAILGRLTSGGGRPKMWG